MRSILRSKQAPQPVSHSTPRQPVHNPADIISDQAHDIQRLLAPDTRSNAGHLDSSLAFKLQRTVGNQATARILARKPAPLPISAASASGIKRVQRRVGFEFEGRHWRPYVQPYGPALPPPNVPPAPRPALRQEALHQGHRFELQGDDTLGANTPTIEFVTQPFELTKPGLADLKQALKEIKAIMKRLSKHVGDETTQIPNNNFVMPAQHGLSLAGARMAGGRDPEEFKMQVTQGIALEDLPNLMEYFGTNVPNETPKQRKERKGARILAHGNETGGSISNMLGGIPTLARQAVAHIYNNRAAYGYSIPDQSYFEGSQSRLVGFFSQVLMVVKGLTLQDGAYMKYKIPFLQRIQMHTVFDELDPTQRRILAANNAQALTDAVVVAANAQSFLPKPAHVGGFWDTGFGAGVPVLKSARKIVDDPTQPSGKRVVPLMASLTLGAWLDGIATGHDYMTPAEMDVWLQNNEGGLNAGERDERTGLLESFNTLGGNMDGADRTGTSRLNVVETRFIAPKPKPTSDGTMTPDAMAKNALQYFNYLLNMKNKGGNPGKF